MSERPQTTHPACENCYFFQQENYRCGKHNFVMPLLEWHMVCRDWRYEGQRSPLTDLAPKHLYYYFFNDGATIQAQLAPFSVLQTLIMSAAVRYDDEFGWIIALRKSNQTRAYFPPNDAYVTINIEGRLSKFQMVNTERRVAIEPVKRGRSQIEHTQEVMLLRSVESKQIVYDWLASIMDIEALEKELHIQSIMVFLEVLAQQTEYAIHPDWLIYRKYKR